MSNRRPYVRSMDGWWKRDAYFVSYMVREVTALFVAASAKSASKGFATVLCVGMPEEYTIKARILANWRVLVVAADEQ